MSTFIKLKIRSVFLIPQPATSIAADSRMLSKGIFPMTGWFLHLLVFKHTVQT
jgi:hypothetical protein